MDDLISRKQVLNASHLVACWDGVEHFSLEVVDADFIQKLPSVQPTQTNANSTHTNALDCVNRQAAIDAIADGLKGIFVEYRDIAEKMIGKLPSAQPEIIRCKDCKFAINADTDMMCGNPKSWVVATENDFGCILAERREQ